MKRFLGFALSLILAPAIGHAEIIANPYVIFSGLDKIMGQTITFEAKIGEEKAFGSLVVKAEVCNTRPITEDPKTTAFVVVDVQASDGSRKRVFSGWMFAESPGLNALEQPIFDIWLTGCRDPNAPPPTVEVVPGEEEVDTEAATGTETVTDPNPDTPPQD